MILQHFSFSCCCVRSKSDAIYRLVQDLPKESPGIKTNMENDNNQENNDENEAIESQIDYKSPPKLYAQTGLNCFAKGCKWSPDGLCILLCTDDHCLRIFDTPASASTSEALKPAVQVREGESVYDYQWYPKMNSNAPESCCMATTSQHQPIHLYDAFDGHIRATYRCFDHLDEMVAARSLAFDPSGSKLVAGLKNQIRIFDVSIPGRDCETVTTFTKAEGGLAGIISCIAFNPGMNQVFALGSYSRSTAVYLDPRAQLLCVLEGQKGGITHMSFSPDGTKLVSGARKDDEILVWDMRNPGNLYATLKRKVTTNQRIYFDFDPTGRFLLSGSTNGSVLAWDLKANQQEAKEEYTEMHADAVNGCSVHPYLPMLATSSGQRHVAYPTFAASDSDPNDDNEDDNSIVNFEAENSLKLWTLK